MSKIEVDAITQQSGSTLTVGGGASKTVVADATTVTLGRCGGTVALASGATQTGFGRTGTVDWDTTPKTATFSAVSGDGFFCDTSSGGFTVNLPAGVAGAIVSLADYANTWNTGNLTVTPNGSNKIGGVNTSVTLSTQGQSITLVYVDSTQGWINTMDSTSNVRGRAFITATGGTVTTSGDFKIHTFTGPGTFCVSQTSSVSAENTVGYLVVAGGGGGGPSYGGGGGAGGFREGRNAPVDNFTASPLVANAPTNAVTISATAFPITVGAGGPTTGTNASCKQGSSSIFSTITSAGGGGGGCQETNCGSNSDGGSGGGSGGGGSGGSNTGGSGNVPPTNPAQGTNGGNNTQSPAGPGGGGGGATAAGSSSPTGNGGTGATTSITGSPTVYSGGGGGGGYSSGPTSGGSGGGGTGGRAAPPVSGTSGACNTGGGGGAKGGTGGSGIVVIRYKFQ